MDIQEALLAIDSDKNFSKWRSKNKTAYYRWARKTRKTHEKSGKKI